MPLRHKIKDYFNMRYLIYFLSLIINLALQSTFLNKISLIGIKPNIILIAVITISCLRNEKEGAVYGFLAGLLQDCYFSSYIGSYVFLYTFIGYFCGFLLKGFYRENFILPMGIVVAVTFLYNFIYYVLNILLLGYTDIMYFILHIILPEMVYNAIASIFIYNFYLFVNNRLEEREKYKHKFFNL